MKGRRAGFRRNGSNNAGIKNLLTAAGRVTKVFNWLRKILCFLLLYIVHYALSPYSSVVECAYVRLVQMWCSITKVT